jgi:hypothetical protein
MGNASQERVVQVEAEKIGFMGSGLQQCGSVNPNPRQRNLFEAQIQEDSQDVERSHERSSAQCGVAVVRQENRLEIENGNSCTQLEQWKLSPTQVKVVEAYRRLGGPSAVAKELGVSLDTVRRHLVEARYRLGKTHVRQLLDKTIHEERRQIRESDVTQANLLRLIESQDYKCALTGEDLTPQTASLDHKTPRSMGGENTIDNVWFVLDAVNKAKGTMSTEQFIDLCRKVVAHADATNFKGPS